MCGKSDRLLACKLRVINDGDEVSGGEGIGAEGKGVVVEESEF